MAVYVDDMYAPFGRMKMCHMMADSREELAAMAARIGLNREWLQRADTPEEHYDVSIAYRKKAVAEGAVEVQSKDLVKIIRAKRKPRLKISTWHDCYSGSHKGVITADSFSHPAKMAKVLCERIFDHGLEKGYWKPGDAILDPFAGVFTTGIIGAYKGYHVIGIELEPRFVRMANGYDCPGVSKRSWGRWFGRLSRVPQLCPECQKGKALIYDGDGVIPTQAPHHYRGNLDKHRAKLIAIGRPIPQIIQGDSRRLIELVHSIHGAITSPPFLAQERGGGLAKPDARYLDGARFGTNHGYQNQGDGDGNLANMKEGSLGDVVGVITSPPYADGSAHTGGIDPHPEYLKGGKYHGVGLAGAITSPPYGDARIALEGGDNVKDFGRNHDGRTVRYSGVITSPPYADSVHQGDKANDAVERLARKRNAGVNVLVASKRGGPNSVLNQPQSYGATVGQIGALPAGDVDRVAGAITSPPYANSLQDPGNRIDWRQTTDRHQAPGVSISGNYGDTDGQLSALRPGDPVGVITSPPWEKNQEGHLTNIKDPETFAREMSAADGKGKRHGTTPKSRLAQIEREKQRTYGESEGQIGITKGETYWEAVAVIYQQLFTLLPAGGVAAIVVKDYVRNKKRVALCDQTVQLLEAIGFKVIERTHAMLVKETVRESMFGEQHIERKERKSFFRRLAEKKGSPRIDDEEILWAIKP